MPKPKATNTAFLRSIISQAADLQKKADHYGDEAFNKFDLPELAEIDDELDTLLMAMEDSAK